MTAPLVIRVPGAELRSLNETLREHRLACWRRQKALCARLAPHIRRAVAGADLAGPVVVTITRVSPRKFDGDNWPAGDCKALRDWLAREVLRRDDKESATLAWVYEQRRGAPREYAVEVRIARVDSAGESARETVAAPRARAQVAAASPTRPRRTAATKGARR